MAYSFHEQDTYFKVIVYDYASPKISKLGHLEKKLRQMKSNRNVKASHKN